MGVGWWVDHRGASQSLSYFKDRLSNTERIKDENNVEVPFSMANSRRKTKGRVLKNNQPAGFVSKGNLPTSQSPYAPNPIAGRFQTMVFLIHHPNIRGYCSSFLARG